MKLQITDIQHGCTHDGPGLRTVVFFKGCPMHCPWCHNPETCSRGNELFFREEKCFGCMECFSACPVDAHSIRDGKHLIDRAACIRCMACADVCPCGALEGAAREVTVESLLRQVKADRVFYRNRGGLTVSGGEPTFQPEGLLALLQGAKKAGIHTCVETCGAFPKKIAGDLAACTDLFLYDVKDTDPHRHQENTGVALTQVLENLRSLDVLGAQTVMRCVLIPKVNLNDAHAHALAQLWHSLQNCQYIELLPYHPFGISKTHQLGKPAVRYREPAQEDLERFAAILTAQAVPTKLHGSLIEH